MPPYYKQETDYYCGPAVVQMILGKVGIIFSQKQLAEELGTTEAVGTAADAIVQLLTLHGLTVKRTNGATLADLEAALAAGAFALVGYIEPEGDPHYALVVALTPTEVVLADPLFGEEHRLPREEFAQRWRDDAAGAYGDHLLITAS